MTNPSAEVSITIPGNWCVVATSLIDPATGKPRCYTAAELAEQQKPKLPPEGSVWEWVMGGRTHRAIAGMANSTEGMRIISMTSGQSTWYTPNDFAEWVKATNAVMILDGIQPQEEKQ